MHSERIHKIQQHLYTNGFANVQELADATSTSLVTVRRDLQRLEEDGIVKRTHGGARLAEAAGPEVAFQSRVQENGEAKRAIAEAAFKLLRPHSTVFLDAGTTVLQLARRIRLEPLPLTVFTNGLAVAQELVNLESVSVNLLGGLLDHILRALQPFAHFKWTSRDARKPPHGIHRRGVAASRRGWRLSLFHSCRCCKP